MDLGVMLNAYPDSMGGALGDIADLLAREELRGAFRSFYILPSVFHTDLDRGFSVISYDLNRRMADEGSMDRLKALPVDLKLDFILNHLSVLSPQFQDVVGKGDASEYRDFFIDWNAFWAGCGKMTEGGYIQPEARCIKDMFFRKPGLPILMVRFPDGREVPYWNTFYQEVRYPELDAQDLMDRMDIQYDEAKALCARINAAAKAGDPSAANAGDLEPYKAAALDMLNSRRRYLGQMDLNIRSPKVWDYYGEVLDKLASYGASIVRLDAFAYAPKTPGMRNFMNEPDTWDVLERLRGMAKARGLTLLPEIHASYAEGGYRTLADKGYMTYDFFLPGLVIDALENHTAEHLARWAQEIVTKGIRVVNMLGCHDGIPLLDLKGLLDEARIEKLIALLVSRGGLVKNLHGQKNMYYQVNATYFSALGEDERKLLLARAIQLFMPGKAQVWYLDLFAGRNDVAAALAGGAAGHKEINRTNLTREAIEEALTRRVVRDQVELMRLRNACPAFAEDAEIAVQTPDAHTLIITWHKGDAEAALRADLETYAFDVKAYSGAQDWRFAQA